MWPVNIRRKEVFLFCGQRGKEGTDTKQAGVTRQCSTLTASRLPLVDLSVKPQSSKPNTNASFFVIVGRVKEKQTTK
jgi:hypothetical protein